MSRTTFAIVTAVACAALSCTARTPAEDRPVVDVAGPYRGDAADRFAASMAPFEERTGIDVRYVGSADLEAQLRQRANDLEEPDVAIIPQPALVAELRRLGSVRPLPTRVREAADRWVDPDAQRLGRVADRELGVPYRLSVKSLVWYRPDQFAARGWEVPESLEELQALTEQIVADGLASWCVGIEAFDATGWVITDWVEDVLLRIAGPGPYEDWVAGRLDFADDHVREAFEVVESLLLRRGHVLGNVSGIVQTRVDEAILPLLDDPPRCALHRNASFTEDWLPEGTTIGPDGDLDYFVLPAASPDEEPPILVGVDLAVGMSSDAATTELLTYLTTPESGAAWAAEGGYIGARRVEDGYHTPSDERVAAILRDADVLRADGSDRMPTEFGSGAFWDLASQWVAGLLSTDDTLDELDAAREDTAPT